MYNLIGTAGFEIVEVGYMQGRQPWTLMYEGFGDELIFRPRVACHLLRHDTPFLFIVDASASMDSGARCSCGGYSCIMFTPTNRREAHAAD
jgi:hypothetical protein